MALAFCKDMNGGNMTFWDLAHLELKAFRTGIIGKAEVGENRTNRFYSRNPFLFGRL